MFAITNTKQPIINDINTIYSFKPLNLIMFILIRWRSPCGIVVMMLDCDIVVSEYKLQFCNYVHFQTYILRKGMNLLIPQLWVK